MDIYEKIAEYRIVPVVVLQNADDAADLAEALIDGGLPIAEVTFRSEAAEESIRIIAEKYPKMLIGAGTVVNVEQAERAVNAGAKFIVSPGFSSKVVEYALSRDIPVLPGVCTPTEMMMANDYGLKTVKFFPASQYGGVAAIKALAAPFPQMRFLPTGGINADNIREYLANPKVIACGGSWMVKSSLIEEGKFAEIRELTRQAVAAVKEQNG